MRAFPRFIACLGACLAAGSAGVRGQGASFTEAEIFEALSGPVKVQSRIGRDFSGQAIEVTPEALVLLTHAGSGSVEYTFNRSDVRQVQLPGNALKAHALDLIAEGEHTRGFDLLELLYQQRSPFFPYTPEAEPIFFAETVALYREHGRAAEGLMRAQALAPWLRENATMRRLLADEILLGLFLTGQPEAAEHAAGWIAAQAREADSALGWYVLGTLRQRAEASDAALFTYLRPIVFSGRRSLPYLAECYAGAIEAALALEQWPTAGKLQAEMRSRGLSWPADRQAAEIPEISPSSPSIDSP